MNEEAVSRKITEHRAAERHRGRSAGNPRHIPWEGWKDILSRLFREIADDRIGTVAAATTFFLLLAIFPALASLVSLYGLVADPLTISDHLADMRGYVPAAVIDLVAQELQRLSGTRGSALSFGFASGLLVALWSTNSGIRALFDALNVVYDEDEKRGMIKVRVIALYFSLGGIVFAILLLNVVIGVPRSGAT